MHITTSESTLATRQDDIVSDVDTFDEVALTEQTMIETFNINLAGHSMNTITTALETAAAHSQANPIAALVRPPMSRHTYLDLFQWIEDKLPAPQIKARVYSSMAWMLDIFTINAARNVFFQMHDSAREIGSIDNYNDFMQWFEQHDIADAVDTSFYARRGSEDAVAIFDETSSESWRDLMLMTSLHGDWHAQAAQALAASRSVIELKRSYVIKSYEDLVNEEKLFINESANEKLVALAGLMVKDQAQAKQIGEIFVNGQESAAKNRLARNKENRHLVLRIIAEAQNRGADEANFYDLSLGMQKKLCQQASQSIARSLTQMSTVKSIPLMDYVAMAQLALVARAELDQLIEDKFGDIDG